MAKFTGDYHTHSNYSDGRATIDEMIAAAKSKGLREIAITDHGPGNIAGGLKSLEKLLEAARKIRDINESLEDFKVLSGVEANILGEAGEIDVPPEIYERLDLLIIGLHPFVYANSLANYWNLVLKNQARQFLKVGNSQVTNFNTKTLVEACVKHKPFAISHPGLGMPIDISEVARACARNDVAYEINCGHLYQTPEELKVAALKGVEFVINSDAHFTETVGNLEPGLEIAMKAGIDKGQIKNLLN
ncbi:PHP domain-containing protein [Desulfitibacter alkalitolerans]|uniref:PHP domain-containing protein n=1 Tax=Desulfitibacter alkalitolerans TaxID=264641 RepID=UPI000686C857|nr:PHP domain-containing protein [Desulfitibacter alkalitolerans]